MKQFIDSKLLHSNYNINRDLQSIHVEDGNLWLTQSHCTICNHLLYDLVVRQIGVRHTAECYQLP